MIKLVKKPFIMGIFYGALLTLPMLALANSPILTFVAQPQDVLTGQTAALSWFSQNTEFCTLSGPWSGRVSSFGAANVFPKETASYGITCVGEFGSVSDSKIITVLNRPANSISSPTVINQNQNINYSSNFGPVNKAFTATCATSPSVGQVGKPVVFAAAQNGGLAPFSYRWSQDISGTKPIERVTFSTNGTKLARITVIDAHGFAAEGFCSIVVNESVSANTVTTATAPKNAPVITVAQSQTCKTVTLCTDEKGNVIQQNKNQNDIKIETAQNGKKSLLASLFENGSGGQSRVRTLLLFALPVLASLSVIVIGYLIFKFSKKA